MKKSITALSAVALLALTGCGGGGTENGSTSGGDGLSATSANNEDDQSPLRQAYDACDEYSQVISLSGPGVGENLRVEGAGHPADDGDHMNGAACLLGYFQVPDRVLDHIDSTSAIHGQRSDEWSNSQLAVQAHWTYHPDRGMTITIEPQ